MQLGATADRSLRRCLVRMGAAMAPGAGGRASAHPVCLANARWLASYALIRCAGLSCSTLEHSSMLAMVRSGSRWAMGRSRRRSRQPRARSRASG